MAKKEKFNSKNVKINEEELSITKIGELSDTEQSSALIFILFGVILVFIFFLPTIVNLIKGNNNKPDYSLIEKPNENSTGDEPSEGEQISYFTLNDTLSIDLEENIKIDTFVLEGNELSFQTTNTKNSKFSFHDENYFLELYSEDDTLLERIFLGDIVVPKGESTTSSFILSSSTALSMKKLLFTKKEIVDYPNVTLEKNDLEEEVLTCTKDTETYTYKFQQEKLFSISHIVSYSTTISNYETLRNTWESNSERLNTLGGINSVFVDAGNGFVVNTTIDLKTAKSSDLDNSNYYSNETLAKVVKFEMEAKGFDCK